jgi:hypothetical protein
MIIDTESKMITNYVIACLASLIVGGAGGAFVVFKITKEDDPAPIVDTTSTQQQEVIKQLTDIDLLEEPCSKEFIEANDDTLCRSMFCLMMTRGIDSQTSGSQCEEISNLANTKAMREDCLKDPSTAEDCYRLYLQRK